MAMAVLVYAQNKPYITKVYDFMPAPGQFINELPYTDELHASTRAVHQRVTLHR